MSSTERPELDERGTEELRYDLADAISELPPTHPMRVLWQKLDLTLTDEGPKALPSGWDDEYKMASLEPAVTDWALKSPYGTTSCGGRDVAKDLHANASHLAIVCRRPGEEYATPAATARHIGSAAAVPIELDTDGLHASIAHAATQFPATHPVRLLWQQLHKVLTLSGPAALPYAWDDADGQALSWADRRPAAPQTHA